MTPDDIAGFYATRAELNPEDYIELDFDFECAGDPREAAAHLCSEQSTAQWRRVGIDEDFRPRFAAKVLELQSEPRPGGFSIAVECAAKGEVHAVRVTIAHPHGNFGAKIPNLLSAVCGEGVFFSPGIPLIRLQDIRFPNTYLEAFQGPQFGVAGLREILQAFGRPIFFGVIKPNIGLSAEPFAELGYQSWLGGLDIAKDDEMLADVDWCPLAERAAALGDARRRAEAKTGVPKIYLANITDEVDRLIPLHDLAVARGANALLVNAMPVGLSAVRMLRKHASVPLIAHFPMIAAFSRLAGYGIHSRVFTRLQRLAGFDVVIMPGFGPRMMTPEHEVLDCVRACLEPMGRIKPCLPVPGGSDSAATLEGVYRKVGSVDFGFVPGRGVFGHPMGPAAGAASIRQAWDAIASGIAVTDHAASHDELRLALATFGGR
ncbi:MULTISPECIES: RuBisCO large subunit C-terminal-like domain-containing protein [Rhodopseudomonas]|uniref:Ribulose 1,5-bisphosphate carboxylase n=1 Tax=Rhodopseudomonas palustris TaxID=1076 RepID=A0A0D7DZE4_RHOPL|nr:MULTISPECIES: RuBisCO large subunit C-terminal-like domain-containing protein [Rhodopseudomonas]KIZ33953.1 ribulose 1,5-bisphosphate carboxylase [Rhodopseudomonas palustris]WOK16427.1 RuBisCO large subunit C-terminal-like domain-containing protein [Rhodopseudomonas sp. BAL398]